MTPRRQRFIEEYLVDLNATQAAIRAGYSEKTASSQGERMLRNVEVQTAIQAGQKARAARTSITADAVLQELHDIAFADPGELIEYARNCCRYCWGEGFRWQETPGEQEERRSAWQAAWLQLKMAGDRKGLEEFGGFDERGGVGFHALKAPNPDCPECFGRGEGAVFVQDSRKLRGPAKRLFSGVKVTRDGLQVLMRNQDHALGLLFDHLGLSGPKRLAGPDGGPIEIAPGLDALADLPREKRDAIRAALRSALDE